MVVLSISERRRRRRRRRHVNSTVQIKNDVTHLCYSESICRLPKDGKHCWLLWSNGRCSLWFLRWEAQPTYSWSLNPSFCVFLRSWPGARWSWTTNCSVCVCLSLSLWPVGWEKHHLSMSTIIISMVTASSTLCSFSPRYSHPSMCGQTVAFALQRPHIRLPSLPQNVNSEIAKGVINKIDCSPRYWLLFQCAHMICKCPPNPSDGNAWWPDHMETRQITLGQESISGDSIPWCPMRAFRN